MDKSSFNEVKSTVLKYVRRNRWDSSFSTNDIRDRVVAAGLNKNLIASAISNLVKSNYIERVGDVPSTEASARGRKVGVYVRTSNSYAI